MYMLYMLYMFVYIYIIGYMHDFEKQNIIYHDLPETP